MSRRDPAIVVWPGTLTWGEGAGHLIPIFPCPAPHILAVLNSNSGHKETRTDTMADAYSGIDFDEINEATGLAADEIKCLKVSLQN